MVSAAMSSTLLVLDNGAHSMKVASGSSVIRVPNCIARSKDDRRIFVGHELDEEKTSETLQYRRPHENVFTPFSRRPNKADQVRDFSYIGRIRNLSGMAYFRNSM